MSAHTAEGSYFDRRLHHVMTQLLSHFISIFHGLAAGKLKHLHKYSLMS